VAQTAEQLVAALLHVSGHVALLTCKEGFVLQLPDVKQWKGKEGKGKEEREVAACFALM
jgi:hypothetical protein